MLELQRIQFAGWALTKGQHRPKAGKKKKTREAGLFFLVPASTRCSIRKWVNPALPIVVLTHPIKVFSISSVVLGKTLSSDLEQSSALEAFEICPSIPCMQCGLGSFHASGQNVWSQNMSIRTEGVQTHQCVVSLAKREEPGWPCLFLSSGV